MFRANNPYCVKLYDVYETAEEVQLVLELLPGFDLFGRIIERLNDGKSVPYTDREAAIIVKRVALAVQHLHSKGIIHRDLKPENILMVSEDDDLEIKVGDFGLAKLFPEEGMQASVTGTYVGTPGYAPPEILNKELYSFNVDVWTLGVCAYIILCGCPPFPQNMAASTVERIKMADVRFPSPHFDAVSDDGKNFLKTCMTPNPKDRPGIDDILKHAWLAKAE